MSSLWFNVNYIITTLFTRSSLPTSFDVNHFANSYLSFAAAGEQHLVNGRMASTSEQCLGPQVRLWGVSIDQLPPLTANTEELAPFITSLLRETIPFLDSISPRDGSSAATHGWAQKPDKTYSDSEAPVHVFERVVTPKTLESIVTASRIPRPEKLSTETWACRRSIHRDAAAKGTASWAEFERCFQEQHRQAEDAFTPAVVSSREEARWDCSGVEVEAEGGTWGQIQMDLSEIRHKIAPAGILRDRVFGVLMLSAALKDADEFIVVSVAVNDLDRSNMGRLVKNKGIVMGAYSSVERVRRLPPAAVGTQASDQGAGIEWIMATASDAKGILPLWLQSKAVTGLIAKDVSLFLSWIARERGKNEEERSNILSGI